MKVSTTTNNTISSHVIIYILSLYNIYMEHFIMQTIIFDKKFFSKQSAFDFLKRHNLKRYKIDETSNTYRFRQQNPGKFTRFFTKELTDGVKAVFAY